MPSLKFVKIEKRQEIPYGLPLVLGLHILKLLESGYRKFEIEDLGDVILIKTWRVRKGGKQ